MKKTYIIPVLRVRKMQPKSSMMLSTSDGKTLKQSDFNDTETGYEICVKDQNAWDDEW